MHLGLSDAKIRIIKADHPCDVKGCCNEMLAEWLKVDPDASWEKLYAVINSFLDSGKQIGNSEGMYKLLFS